jgi:hypothetical protein
MPDDKTAWTAFAVCGVHGKRSQTRTAPRSTYVPRLDRRSRKVVRDRNLARHGLAYVHASGTEHPAETPEPLWRGMHARSVLPLWGRCLPRRRGSNTRAVSAASSGQGHVRADGGLPTPCRREDSLHVSQPVSTVRAGGSVNERKNRAGSCLPQTTVHLVRSGTRHRWMVQVQFLAGWLVVEAFQEDVRKNPTRQEAMLSLGLCTTSVSDRGIVLASKVAVPLFEGLPSTCISSSASRMSLSSIASTSH